MKRLVMFLSGIALLAGTASAQTDSMISEPRAGVSGWTWISKTDPMTDTPFVNFVKQASDENGIFNDTALIVEYVDNSWIWGLIRSSGWKGDKRVTYRLDKEPAKEETFENNGRGWLLHIGLINKETFLKYAQLLIRIEDEDPTVFGQPSVIFRFDITGLAETIKMAGIN